MIDLKSLEVFHWVVKLGGFGRAAERLYMTQPAISARIAQIEARYGVRLLDRGARRALVPTAKGLALFAHAEQMLALQAEMLASLTGAAEIAGPLRLGVAETLVHTLLGPLLGRLHQRHQLVTPEVTVADSPALRAALLAGELDLALLLGPLTDPPVVNVPLGAWPLGFVAGPALALPAGKLDLAALAGVPLLSFARGTLPHAELAALAARAAPGGARIFPVSSLAAILRMAADGIGIGVVPLAVAAADLAAGRLRRLDVAAEPPPLRFTASYLRTPAAALAGAVAALAGEVAADAPRGSGGGPAMPGSPGGGASVLP